MAKPYSEDLRRCVLETINGGATIPDTAEQCGNGPKLRSFHIEERNRKIVHFCR